MHLEHRGRKRPALLNSAVKQLLRYRIFLEQKRYAPTTINLRLAAVRRVDWVRVHSYWHATAVLEDRFKLKIHRENRQGPVYELTLGKGTPKLKPIKEGSCTPVTIGRPLPPLAADQRYCRNIANPQGVDLEGGTLAMFAGLLGMILDRPVIDKTGITDLFAIHLEFSPDDFTSLRAAAVALSAAAGVGGRDAPGIFQAIQEQLGLRLVPARGPVDLLVIDHIERTSENREDFRELRPLDPNFLEESLAILTRTPATLNSQLRDLPDAWTSATEGPGTWSPYIVVGHLIHAERTDWIPRLLIILEHGNTRPFDPFDREAQLRQTDRKSLPDLLDEFRDCRNDSVDRLRAMHLAPAQLELTGRHPELGPVTVRQLLATWTAHDLAHILQIARVMAKRYRQEVGPWAQFLSVMK